MGGGGGGGGSVTAKPNNGVSCAARPLQHSPAPMGHPEPLSVDGTVSTEVRRGVVCVRARACMCVCWGGRWRRSSWFPSLLLTV